LVFAKSLKSLAPEVPIIWVLGWGTKIKKIDKFHPKGALRLIVAALILS
jgi:hypothetical protein